MNKTTLVLFILKLILFVNPQDIVFFFPVFSISETSYIKFPETKRPILFIKESAFIGTFAFITLKIPLK
jgi:hypothetical protein